MVHIEMRAQALVAGLSRCSIAFSAAASIRLIITGVASTRTLPLPMLGAVCSRRR